MYRRVEDESTELRLETVSQAWVYLRSFIISSMVTSTTALSTFVLLSRVSTEHSAVSRARFLPYPLTSTSRCTALDVGLSLFAAFSTMSTVRLVVVPLQERLPLTS
jgi:hypothetical protein